MTFRRQPSSFKLQTQEHGRHHSNAPCVTILLETSTEYGRGILRGIGKYVSLHGPWAVRLLPGHLQQFLPSPRFWGADGIITRIRSPRIEQIIRATALPFVASDLSERTLKGDSIFGRIVTDGYAIGRIGAEHLFELGLRHYAFCGFHGCMWSYRREQAFVDFLRARGFQSLTYRLHPTTWLQRTHWIDLWKDEQPALAAWLKTLPLSIGVMVCNDVCGIQLLQVCSEVGLRVPDDIAVLGVDNDEMVTALANPPLSSIALDLEKAGYEAAHILDALMSHRSIEAFEARVYPAYVAARQSTGFIAQEDPIVARALQTIRDEARHGIGVVDVIDKVGVSRRTLERRFSKAVGRTVHAEIARRQLELAKRMLVQTDMTSEAIARSVGFGTVETFNRAFRRSTSLSPQRFRRH